MRAGQEARSSPKRSLVESRSARRVIPPSRRARPIDGAIDIGYSKNARSPRAIFVASCLSERVSERLAERLVSRSTGADEE